MCVDPSLQVGTIHVIILVLCNTVGCTQWARRAKKRKGRLTKKVEKEENENEEKVSLLPEYCVFAVFKY